MKNNIITTFPFYTITELIDYLKENKYYSPEIKLPKLINPNLPYAEKITQPILPSYTIQGKKIDYLGYCNRTSQHIFTHTILKDIVEYYVTNIIWSNDSISQFITADQIEKQLVYIFTVNNSIITNINLDSIFDSTHIGLNYRYGYSNFPEFNITVSEYIKSAGNSRIIVNPIKHKSFRYTFGSELMWSNVCYPIHCFSAEDINLTIFKGNQDFPSPLASKDSKFITLCRDDYNNMVDLYVGGMTTYLSEFEQLNSLRYILLRYIYLNSKVNGKYNYLVVSINHCRNKLFSRVIITKHYIEKDYTYLIAKNSINVNLGKKFASLKTINSKKTLELEKALEQWLEHHNLFTDELTVSNYIVTIKDDFVFHVTNFLEDFSEQYPFF